MTTNWEPPASWGTPYQGYTPQPPALPWYRTNVFLVLGGLGLLLAGGLAGVVLTFVGVGVAGVSGAFDAEATTYGEGGDLTAFALGAGQCATDGLDDATGYEEGAGVLCADTPHGIEHYATAEPPTLAQDGGRFPRGDLTTFADSACYLAFDPYVGLTYNDSAYEYRAVIPSEAAWNDGVRTVHCVLWLPDGEPDLGSAHRSNT